MIKKYDPKKGDKRLHGPYRILDCRTKGTVIIQRKNPMVQETYKIRKIVPYRGPSITTLIQNQLNYYEQQVSNAIFYAAGV